MKCIDEMNSTIPRRLGLVIEIIILLDEFIARLALPMESTEPTNLSHGRNDSSDPANILHPIEMEPLQPL